MLSFSTTLVKWQVSTLPVTLVIWVYLLQLRTLTMTFTHTFVGVSLVSCSSSCCVAAVESDWLLLFANVQVNLWLEFAVLSLSLSGRHCLLSFFGSPLSSPLSISLHQPPTPPHKVTAHMMFLHLSPAMEIKNSFICTTLSLEPSGPMLSSKPSVSLSSLPHAPCGTTHMDQDNNSTHPS